jgi:ABC-type polysaccharide/polyol phosphate transport system ATPase subunit
MTKERLVEFIDCEFGYQNYTQFDIKKLSFNKIQNEIVIKKLNLTLDKNKIYGVLGKNGSGKSTLLRLVFNHLFPSSGNIIRNFSKSKLLDRADVYHDELNAFDNFKSYYSLDFNSDFNNQKYKNKLEKFVELTTLPKPYLYKPFSTLSEGMKSKVAFALNMVFIENLDLLGLDEFFSFGDSDFKKVSGNYMREVLLSSGSAIVVSHDTNLLSEISDEILVMHHGELVEFGKPSEMINVFKKM